MRKTSKIMAASVGVSLLAGLVILQLSNGAQAAGGEGVTAVYRSGTLHLEIPYRNLKQGGGELRVEVLDPEDRVLGQVARQESVSTTQGAWTADLAIAGAPPLAEVVWQRVRYRFQYGGAKQAAARGTESISQIVRMPVVHVVGQQSYLAGAMAAVRVIVSDARNREIAGDSMVRVELVGATRPRVLYAGKVNRRGTMRAQFRMPAGVAGKQTLRYVVDTPIGSTELTQPVKVTAAAAILLTTEKPVYQPGQIIHVRALALDRANQAAAAGRKITIEVEDSRGNKVFRKPAQTSAYGVASAEFPLADEVNLGTYHVRALMEAGAEGGDKSEVAVRVERYVLPKFKVAVELTGEVKHGYRPGDHVAGTVRANYFFGKAVDGAEIVVKGTAMDLGVVDAGVSKGRTDAEGVYKFDLTLPKYFAGLPANQGSARVLIEATVKDGAGHAETKGESVTVRQSPLLLTAIPESGALAPGVENQVFVLASYADGSPAAATLKVRAAGNGEQTVTADSGGVAVVKIRPAGDTSEMEVEASDGEGNLVKRRVPLEVRQGDEHLLLHTDRAVYRAGERMVLKVLSSKAKGAAYVDIVRNGQTIVTRDLDLVNGVAELQLAATPDMAGTLDFNAYLLGPDGRAVGDHRLVFVHPADELKIEAGSDAPVYKPGSEARVRFRVTNSKGEGVQAALGVQVVDEAVLALAEKRPGFAKVFFYLEQESLQPRYEIHGFGLPDVVEPVEAAKVEQHDRAARALFAATEVVQRNRFETETGRTPPQVEAGVFKARYQAAYEKRIEQLAEKWTRAYQRNRNAGDVTALAAQEGLRDAWDGEIRTSKMAWGGDIYEFASAGPDRQFGTADDLWAAVAVQRRKMAGPPVSTQLPLVVDVEHDRGPFNGRTEIAGSVKFVGGGMVAGAVVAVRETATGMTRTASPDSSGQFTLAGLVPGTYEVKVTAPGFAGAARTVALKARDRAVAMSEVRSGAAVETLVVARVNAFGGGGGGGAAMPRRIAIGGNIGGVVGGVPGGQQGGVLGGIVGAQFDAGRLIAAPSTGPLPQMKMMLADREMAVNSVITVKKEAAGGAPRVRSYFPEALYINPEIVTDADGRASVVIPMADSITTWRMALLASTARGALGSGTSSLKVFQDFFVDLDMPVTLTQGDRVSIPVAAYNYSGAAGTVALELKADDWYTLVDDAANKDVAVESGRVGGAQFTVEAKRIGKFKLTLSARMAGGANHADMNRADIVVREIEVVPNGREQNLVFNGRLESAVRHDVNFPEGAIPDAEKIFVRLYPGPLSQVIEGMDAILRMPGGCFEQTSSSTYPNVLALDYMKRTKKLTPEVHAKAESYIVNGYQRLLTFEAPGGGFSWFGNAPANKILTSYGLMEFGDMAQVHDVDARLIQRTQQWLAAQQQADGSWKADTQFINEGATNLFNSDVLRITAYIAWSLQNTGYQGPAVDKAKQFIEQKMGGKVDTYTSAVIANLAADYGRDRAFTERAMHALLDARTEKDEQAWWNAEETAVYATGSSAAVETTGLAAQALLKWGGASATVSKALAYLAAKKDAGGTWGNTQATIMALRAILLSTGKGAADVRGTVEVSLNGRTVETLQLTAENNDLLHQFALKGVAAQGTNVVELRFRGKGQLAYQVVGRHFVPWDQKPEREALSISVNYDRTRLAEDDVATATATVMNNLKQAAKMVMVDLGIPPGFDLLSEDLQAFQEKTAGRKGGRLEKFSLTATQAILYFDALGAGETISLPFRLRAKYPIRARTFQSRVYEYYNPEVNAVARPVQLEVRRRER